ncbi:MAG: class II fumarate hydratase [Planctomycetes bacterium]|nr:class II fumarate hydratase [Planctomycetota bacterium]
MASTPRRSKPAPAAPKKALKAAPAPAAAPKKPVAAPKVVAARKAAPPAPPPVVAAPAPAPVVADGEHRVERDSMGEVRVPAQRMWGAQTQRAVENFRVSGRTMPSRFLVALAHIKAASAQANEDLGLLDPKLAAAIRAAADEVVCGKHDAEFPIDVFQTGSGTSSNMNMNEVLSNLANRMLGGAVGSKKPVHPNDHVNMGQSSNDVIPTALHVAVATAARERLLPALAKLAAALHEKAKAFDDVVKVGRTHLQDATPVRMGQVFGGYAAQVAHGAQRVALAWDHLLEVALGGTAVGTGIGRDPQFHGKAIERLSARTGLALRRARNPFEALAGREACVFFAGALASAAAALTKVANDVRFLGSGPRCGYGELKLPELQPGSSIMPGKVNPVMSESLIMACLLVQGANTTVAAAGGAGNFELNVTLPLLAMVLLDAVETLAGAVEGFTERCVRGLEVDRARVTSMVEQSLMLATALAPKIGYDAAAAMAKEAYKAGTTIRALAEQKKVLPPDELAATLDLRHMTEPGRGGLAAGG